MLTGQNKSLDDFQRHWPRLSKEKFPKNVVLVDQFSAIAKKKSCTPGELTLAWTLAQGEDFIPIPGTTKVKNLEENAAVELKLIEEEVQETRQACKNADVSGARYPEQMRDVLFADSAPK